MARWSLSQIILPLSRPWKIARGEVTQKENLIISYEEGKFIGKGEVAFLTNKGPKPQDIESEFKEFLATVKTPLNGIEDMMASLSEFTLSPNLRCGIETAYIHFLAQLMEDKVQRVLGIREVTNVPTSFSIPHLETSEIEDYFYRHSLSQYSSLKIKIVSAQDGDYVQRMSELYRGPLRLDGNECFQSASEALEFLKDLKARGVDQLEFIEQPIAHDNFDECCLLREESLVQIMADEALQSGGVVDDFQRAYHGVNIKLQKAGGYFAALRQMKEARALGFKIMLGCMIETTLGISSALNIAHGVDYYDLDGFLHLKKDPYDAVFVEKGNLLYSFHH